MSALDLISDWPVDMAAAGWRTQDGRWASAGPVDRPFALASVTKPLFAMAVLIAVEEGILTLDQPAGPDGSTVAHLLSHSSGLGAEFDQPSREPGTRRVYSNAGFDELGRLLGEVSGMTPQEYFYEAVVLPLGLNSTWLDGSPAHGGVSCVADLMSVIAELQQPTLIHPVTLDLAVSPVFSKLSGVLPGFGKQDPNAWGLGFEIRGEKAPHWTGSLNSAATFGHFGAAGTFLLVDPVARVGVVCLTDRAFGPWAADVWPPFCDSVVLESNTRPSE